ncbi:MAG: hypothetical protein AAF938_02635 [Myxococcota bacterium]
MPRTLLFFLVLSACGDDSSPALDASADAPIDSPVQPDSAIDAAVDVASDGSRDGAATDGMPDTAPDVAPAVPELFIDGHDTDVFVEDASIDLTGTAVHPVGIESIRVNGMLVESDDDFRTWRFEQALAWGANSLDVEAFGLDGGRATRTLNIERRISLGWVIAASVDEDAREVYALTQRTALPRTLLRIGLDDGVRIPLLQGADAEAVFDSSVRDIVWDASSRRLFVLRQRNVIAVPIAEDGTVGESVEFSPDAPDVVRIRNGNTMVLDTARRQLLVHDLGASAIVAVNLGTGARTLVSSAASAGPAMLDHDLRLAVAGDRIVATGFRVRAISAVYAIDIATGARAVLSDNTGIDFGDPLFLDRPRCPVVVPDGSEAYVFDRGDVLAVDLNTGVRRAITVDPVYAEFDAFFADASVVAFDDSFRRLVAFERATPSLRIVSGNRFPRDAGVDLQGVDAPTLVLLADTFYAGEGADTTNLFSLRDEARTTVIEAQDSSWVLAPQAPRNRLVAFEDGDTEGRLFIVDGATGESTRLASFDEGMSPETLAATPSEDAAYGFNEEAIWRFDLSSGERVALPLTGLPTDGGFVSVAPSDDDVFVVYGSFIDDTATVHQRVDDAFVEVSGRDDSGPSLVDAVGAAWTEDGVVVLCNAGLVRINMDGTRELLSSTESLRLDGVFSDGASTYARALDGQQLYRLRADGTRLGLFDLGRTDT